MADGGKGSTPRPYSVDQKTFDANWDAIFKKDKSESVKESDEKIEDYSEEGPQ